MEYHRDIAKVASCELGFEDHGILTLMVGMNGGSWGQGLPAYSLKEGMGDYIAALLRAFAVDTLNQVKGRTVFVLREQRTGPIVGIEPLPTENGDRLVFEDFWENWRNDNGK